MDRLTRGIDAIIRAAMEEGAFDNLPGAGRPLELDENPYLDREWQLAYHLLKQNGFAPDFIERRQAIEQQLAAARELLARSWAWRQRALDAGEDAGLVESQWRAARATFETRVDELNKQIKHYNLSVPNPRFSRARLVSNREIEQLKQGD
jgi:DnaJ family protein C protein 28